MSFLAVEHITKKWNDKPVLEDISFKLQKGKTLVIFGKSGAGKSTLLKIIAGLIDSDEGQILLSDKIIPKANQKLIPGIPEIKLVNQDFELSPYHTVKENIRLKILHYKKEEQEATINELLELAELTEFSDQKVISISGGQQQRLALIRALACKPVILLLDEPFVHLDRNIKNKINLYITKQKEKYQTTIILVTHDGKEALSWADEILFLNKGKIERLASPKDFYEFPKNREEGLFFGELNEVTFKQKIHLFRPEMYEISMLSEAISVKIETNKYIGRGFLNYGVTSNNEKIVLESTEPLKTELKIIPK